MYSFVNLFIRHLLFSIFFIVAVIATSATYLSFYIETKAMSANTVISQFIEKLPEQHSIDITSTRDTELESPIISQSSNAQDVINQLPQLVSLKSLAVTSFDNTLNYENTTKLTPVVITNFEDNKLPEIAIPHVTRLFNLFYPAEDNVLESSDKNISLTYQIDITHEIQLWFAFLIIVSVSALLMMFLSLTSTLMGRRFKNKKLDRMISEAINNVGGTSDKNSIKKHQLISSVLPKTSQVLQLLEAQFNTSASETTALETKAYYDPVTHLENRNRFVQFYTEQINNGKVIELGSLIIIRSAALQSINQESGYHEGDKYICNIADLIKKAVLSIPDAKVFRLNSSDFAIILPNIPQKSAESVAQKLTVSFNEFQQSTELEAIAYSGVATFTKEQPLGELLALTDTAISIAQTKQINAWHCQSEDDILAGGAANLGNLNWRDEITSVIDNQRIKLLAQPIKPSTKNKRVYNEVLSRFISTNGDTLPTASFFAMAEKLDKISDIDRLIVDKTIELLIHKSLHDHFYGINISARTMQDEQFIVWLERRLLRDPAIAAKLIFEISEKGLQQNITNSKRIITMIHRVGARVTVERFGVGLTSFKLFRHLKPDFIKMDSSYTRDIDEDKNNQYFLRLMVDLAHRLSITVLAESVENQNERFTLEKLFVDGCQGFYIGKPEPL